MGLINPTYDERVKYTLQNKTHGSFVITEPIGWRSDEKQYARHKKYHGIFAKFSNSLKFIDDGADYIKFVYDLYGINAEIRLIRDEQHPHTDLWVRSYDGFLDLSTYSIEDRKVSVKFNSSGLEQLLKSRESEKVEIERLDTIDGIAIKNLDTKNVELQGRRIFLQTTFNDKTKDNTANVDINTNIGATRVQTVGYPFSLENKSHENAHDVDSQIYANKNEENGNAAMMFFANSDKARDLNIDINGSTNLFVQQYEHVDWAKYKINLVVYENGTDYNVKHRIELYDLGSNHPWFGRDYNSPRPQFTQNATFSYNGVIKLLEGESLAIEGYVKADFHRDNNAGIRVFAQNITGSIKIEENSFFDKSNSKIILAHELGERLTEIITNKNDVFYSEVLGRQDIGYSKDGMASFTGFAHGFWIRGFDKHPLPKPATATKSEIVNKYKGFTTSFRDYIENLSVIWNIGLGIEKIGFRERIRIEKLQYFYNNNVTIKLPNQVNKIKRSAAKEFYYSALEFGYSKGGEYEEAMGLDEYNAKSTFTTVINRVKKTYRKISKYRTDSYGMEFARRKIKNKFSTQDSPYDKDIFVLDLKQWYGNIFKQRQWSDDFSQKPTGTFSPETATNLRFSPFNMMLRHGWVVVSGLTKYLTGYVRYASSTANSGLKTKLKASNQYAENGNIINAELPRARYLPEWIEFEHIVDFETIRQVEGVTTILGKKIPNFYGLVQFTNENNEIEKGYLFSLKPNGGGKWKLLKANR